MKKVPEQTGEKNSRSDYPPPEIELVIQSLQDITREIEKLTTTR